MLIIETIDKLLVIVNSFKKRDVCEDMFIKYLVHLHMYINIKHAVFMNNLFEF